MRISDWSSDVCSSDLAGVIFLHRAVIIADRDRDAVLGAFELAHQRREIGLALDLWIGLDGREQAAQRAPQLALRGRELLHLGGVGEILGIDLDRGRPRARVNDGGRSEERRVVKEGVSPCRYRWSPYN